MSSIRYASLAPVKLTPTRLGALGLTLGQGASGAVSIGANAATGAKVGSAFGPIGTGIGAAVGAIAGALGLGIGKKAPYEFASYEQYKTAAGKYRGWEYNPKDLNTAFVGLMRVGKTNNYPPRKYGGYSEKDDDRFTSDLAKKVAGAVQSGVLGPNDTPDSVFSKVVEPWVASMVPGGRWDLNHPGGPESRWITRDLTDAYIAGLPITWQEAVNGAETEHPYPKFADVISSAPQFRAAAPPPAPAPPPSATTPVQLVPTSAPPVPTQSPIFLPAPAAAGSGITAPVSLAPTNLSPSSAAPDMTALINGLLAQGASSQQAFTSAISQLASSGYNVTPQVQQAVGAQVENASGGLLKNPYVLLGGAGAVALLLIMMSKKRGRR